MSSSHPFLNKEQEFCLHPSHCCNIIGPTEHKVLQNTHIPEVKVKREIVIRLAYLILGELRYVIHCSIRLYLRVEVIDDGSETKKGNFHRSPEQCRDAAETPHQPETVHLEPRSSKKCFSLNTLTACSAEGKLPAESPVLIQSHAHWKMQTQALPCAWVRLSQQRQGCARGSGRGSHCLAGTSLQTAQFQQREAAKLDVAAPSCSGTLSLDPVQNWHCLLSCFM